MDQSAASDHRMELVVLEGRKHGAKVALHPGRATTVGVGYDCDIVLDLPDLSQSNDHTRDSDRPDVFPIVELLYAENQLSLKVLQGSVVVDGHSIESGVESSLATGTHVQIRNHVFEVRPQSQHDSYPATEVMPSANLPGSEKDTGTSEVAVTVPEQRRKTIFAGAMQSVAGILVLGGSFWAYTNIERPEPVAIQEVVSGVESDLETGGFSDLDVTLQDDNTIAVNGYLQNRSDLHKAREQVQVPDYVEWDVKLGDSLAESVGSVYRVNGVDAKVDVLGEGAVSVNTATNDLDLLQRVEESVYQDVADLRELNLVNELPEVEVEAEDPPLTNIDDLPGKRIVMIVASAPKYIQTEDGSRYFEGSILPSGHLVVAILDEKIQLKLDEKQLDLSY